MPVPALAIAGIAAAVASIASGAMGIASKRREQERANAYNRQMSDLQFQRELQIMNFQNEYNSPINQRKRLEEAGYNPNFVDAANMSADAVAPETAPYEMQDYSGDISQMINSPISALQTFFGLQQQSEALKGASLANEYKDQQVKMLHDNYNNLPADLLSKRITLYHNMLKQGVNRDLAYIWTLGSPIEWHNRRFSYGRQSISSEFDSSDPNKLYGDLGDIYHSMLLTESKLKDTQLSQAMTDYNFSTDSYGDRLRMLGLQNNQLESNTYEMSQKMAYAKKVAEYIKSQDKLSDFEKTTLIIGANSFIYNGQDSGLNILNYVNPIQFAKSIIPKKPTPINKTNNYNYNLQTEKTNIINN